MGNRLRRPLKQSGINRRNFIKGAVAGAAVVAAPLLPGCTSNSATGGPSFLHGVASGDPLSDRVILWTRVTPANAGQIAGTYVVATDTALAQIVASGSFLTDDSRDYTVKIDVTGLSPATTYYYQFSVGTLKSPVARTRTLPVGAVERMRIGVAVCASLAHGYFNAYARLATRADLDFVIHLGDYIYEYGNGEYGSARSYEPPTNIVTLSDYRMRHAQYKREAELQAMHRQHPIIAIWDDHEFANNSWQGGALGPPVDSGAHWQARVAAALQAYYEWMPTRVPDPSDPRRNWRSFELGDLASLFMLEERVGARAQQIVPPVDIQKSGFGAFSETGAFEDSSRLLLSAAEEQWPGAGLRAAGDKWKLLGQGVMFAQLKLLGMPNASPSSLYFNNDQWDGYDPVRQRIFGLLKGDATHAPVSDVVVLTGDIHRSWAADLTPDPNQPPTALTDGYDSLTGSGSLAVEFVSTSVTSPFPNAADVLTLLNAVPELAPIASKALLNHTATEALTIVLKAENPHFKYVELSRHGYLLLDLTPARLNGEWWFVDTIDQPGGGESFATAWLSTKGQNHLQPGVQTQPKAIAPPLAP
jgi:alkaline phosphatase D